MLLIISVSIIIGCSSTNSTIGTGTLIEPTVKINPSAGSRFGGTTTSKAQDFEQDLPLELWDSYEIKQFTVPGSDFDAKKKEFCVISGTGPQITVGEKVEIIDEAKCLNTQYDKGDGSPFRRYPVGLIKIRTISTGQEGWTWTKSVEYDK